MVGFMASTIGHSATKALVEMRQKNRPEDTSDVHLASVMQNSLGWGYFMATSSSPRYDPCFIIASLLSTRALCGSLFATLQAIRNDRVVFSSSGLLGIHLRVSPIFLIPFGGDPWFKLTLLI